MSLKTLKNQTFDKFLTSKLENVDLKTQKWILLTINDLKNLKNQTFDTILTSKPIKKSIKKNIVNPFACLTTT